MSGYDEMTDMTADLMGLQDVHRWTVIKMGKHQSVAEHAFGVAVIAGELLFRMNLHKDHKLFGQVMSWALVHDAPETLTGDIDGKFKREYPNVRESVYKAEMKAFPWFAHIASHVSPEAVAVVKLADKIEALNFVQVWGRGARADSVARELRTILFEDVAPASAKVLELDPALVVHIARHIIDHSVSETNSIQMRSWRSGAVKGVEL